MKKINIIIVLTFITIYALGQKKQMVTFNAIEKPTTLVTSDSFIGIHLQIYNIKAKRAFVGNVPERNLSYLILKKEKDNYISLDTSCIVVSDYKIPLEGWQDIPFKVGQKILLWGNFPPWCSTFRNGEYKIKYHFTYLIGKKLYTVETPWYDYTVDILENRGKQ